MAGGCNKFSFVSPGPTFEWNLMRLFMGPLFDMRYREKWSNSVRRPFFSRFEPFGVDLQRFFLRENFHPKNLSREHQSHLTGRNETIMSSR